jgi:hypothetical protein
MPGASARAEPLKTAKNCKGLIIATCRNLRYTICLRAPEQIPLARANVRREVRCGSLHSLPGFSRIGHLQVQLREIFFWFVGHEISKALTHAGAGTRKRKVLFHKHIALK